jgi:chemotaxis protein MotB
VLRVQGSLQPLFDKDDPHDPVNRRISIIVMNRDAEDRFFGKRPGADGFNAAASAPRRRRALNFASAAR